MLYGETVQSPLPQDIPWWSPDFSIFFGVLYIVLFVIGSGVGYVVLRAVWETWFSTDKDNHAAQNTHGEQDALNSVL